MASYFFNATVDGEIVPDTQGVDREDAAAVRRTAIAAARSLMASAVQEGASECRGRIDVRDEWDALVLTVLFACPIGLVVSPAGDQGFLI